MRKCEDPYPFPRLHLVAFGRDGGLVLERFLERREEGFVAHVIVDGEEDLPPVRTRARWHWPPLSSPTGMPSRTPKQFVHELGRANTLGWRRGDIVAAIAPGANLGTLSGVERLLAHADRAVCTTFFLRLGKEIGEEEERHEAVDLDDVARKLAAELAVMLPGIVGTDATAYLELRRTVPPQGWSVGVATARRREELADAAREAVRAASRDLTGRPLRVHVTIGITVAAGLRVVEPVARAVERELDFEGDAELNVEVFGGEGWEVDVGVTVVVNS